MFDYYATIQKANSVTRQASDLRTQANNISSLLNIVGNEYSGKDAQAYYDAVKKAQNELLSIASKLDSISAQIRSAAETVREEKIAKDEIG